MKKVAIVILNYNGTRDTTECLESIGKLILEEIKLLTIVVDNGSTDSLQAISNFKFQISNFQFKLIKNEKNLGFAGGNNVGIKYVLREGSDYILILNNDTVVDKNLIKELLETAESDSKTGIVVPKIYFAKGHEYHRNRYKENELGKIIWYAGGIMDWKNIIGSHRGVDQVDTGQYDQVMETEFATGCAMFVKKEIFEKVGLFDEKYFLYYEDADLSERVKNAGYKIIYAPAAIIWHKNAGSAGGSGSRLQDYYTTRNRLLFGMEYASLRAKIALIKESLKLLFLGRYWQKKGVADFYLKRFQKGSFNFN